ncbi:MAG: LptF/LptG family permease [Chlamydiae bacterium]|nr:LptF/LptG family permease [Chlamydiota bacterium]
MNLSRNSSKIKFSQLRDGFNMKIWQRYLLKEFFKFFLFFLPTFYFAYVIIDYSCHIHNFIQNQMISFSQVFVYYSFQFFKRINILIPLSLLLSTIKVLTSLNIHFELVALQSAGLSLKKLIRSFLIVGSIFCGLNLLIEEYIFPVSLNYIDKFYYSHLKHPDRQHRKEPVHLLYLDDHSKFFYQYFDPSRESFFDVIWIKNHADIWRVKYLKAAKETVGQYVDHLEKTKEGVLEKTASYSTFVFKDLKLEIAEKAFVPLENRSLSSLFQLIQKRKNLSAYETGELKTLLYYKIAMPFLCILTILAVSPFCVPYSRTFPLFFTYSISLFLFVTFFALMNGSLILGANTTINPFFAIFVPFSFLFLLFGLRFYRMGSR